MLQTRDEMELLIGKSQYKLLLAQWERSHAQRQMKLAIEELRGVRGDEMKAKKELSDCQRQMEGETQTLKERLQEAMLENDRLRENHASNSNFTPDKAKMLAENVAEISRRKTELEDELQRVRSQKNKLAAQVDEATMQARHAAEVVEELKAKTVNDAVMEGKDDLAESRKRVMDLAEKLSDSRLTTLRAQRKIDELNDQFVYQTKANTVKEKEIEKLQKFVSETELKLNQQEEEWRQKLREGQELRKVPVRRLLRVDPSIA